MPHIIKIEGVIGYEVDAENIGEQLEAANGKDVVVEIASPGGLISEGLLIYNKLKNYKGKVDTHLNGMNASMATYIAMVGKRRTAENNSVFMIHNGSALAIGDHKVMFKVGNHLNSLSNIIAKEYALKSDTGLEEIREAMDETTFYYGDEIKEAGFVHEVVGDVEPEDREEAVAIAELMVEECQSKINTPELIKKDMTALATMMSNTKTENETEIKSTKIDDNDTNKLKEKKEDKTMTIEEIKAQFREVYNQIMSIGLNDGVTQERARVKTLVEMRAKFPKAHSQNVIDQAIVEGHELNQVSINLMSAEQVATELEKGKDDDDTPPGNGGEDVPEMKDGKMTHPEHIDAMSKTIAKMPGVM